MEIIIFKKKKFSISIFHFRVNFKTKSHKALIGGFLNHFNQWHIVPLEYRPWIPYSYLNTTLPAEINNPFLLTPEATLYLQFCA